MSIPNTYETVLQHYKVNPDTGCWEWTRGLLGKRDRYGRIRIQGRAYLVHRVSAHLFLGLDLSTDTCVLHTCDNPRCLNPTHLFLGDRIENNADCVAKGRDRHPAGEQHGRAKLSQADVAEIRRLNGLLTAKKTAEKFGVSSSLISLIRTDRIWKV